MFNKPTYIPEFITEEEVAAIKKWDDYCWENKAIPVNPTSHSLDRCSESVYKLSPPDEWFNIRDRVISCIGGESLIEDTFIGFRLMHHLKGAEVFEHIDPTDEGKDVLRVNIMIRKPISGGNPFISGVEYEVQPGDLWAFIGNKMEHGCTKSLSDRTILSFGFFSPSKEG